MTKAATKAEARRSSAAKRLVLTKHAADRLAERFGWSGTIDDAAAHLSEQPVIQVALALGIETGKIKVPGLDIVLYFRSGVVTTVANRSTQAAHNARRANVVRKSTKSGVRPRAGSRGRRAPRPEVAEAWIDD